MPSINGKSVVIYDGECGFCRSQVERIRRMDKRNAFELVARQTPGIEDRFPKLADGDFNTGMRLFTPGGQVYIGADAVQRIAAELPFWRRLAWVYYVPIIHGLSQMAYSWVARHRMRLSRSCKSGTCDIGKPT